MEKKEIKEQLKHSLEVSTIRLWMKFEVGLVLVVCLLHFLINLNTRWEVSHWEVYGLASVLVLVPIFGVHIRELRRIYRNYEAYQFYQVKLSQPHSSDWSRARSMYFTVLLQDEEGTIVANTHSIFGTNKRQIGPLMEDYLNETVTVGYNEETAEVVVIG